VIKKKAQNILKYKNVTTEIQHMWNVKANIIPVITGTIRTISKLFRKQLSSISGKQEMK
jgi:hypothetical protein